MTESVSFGPFELRPAERLLTRDGVPVEIGSRALDVLAVLLEQPGEIVDRSALLDRVWAGVTVTDGSLRAHVAALRKALGDSGDTGGRYVATVAGRGYAFVASMTRNTGPAHPPGPARVTPGLPAAKTELIGREAELRDVLALHADHRLLTLAGPGGIGKTTLALAAARCLARNYAGAVAVADLTPLDDSDLVAPAIVAALGLQRVPSTVAFGEIVASLERTRLLLVIDNCEHVVERVAEIAEALLQAPEIRLIVTSQEPLRAAGECVYRVPPLATGEDGLSGSGALDLFTARVRDANPDFALHGELRETVGMICRRVDGIPLAIELAASRAALIGLEGVAAGLDRRFELLRGGRRTAAPRHQTMRAALEWSVELLSVAERHVLGQLGVFAGSFPLAAAEAVAAGPDGTGEVAACVANLVVRSLVSREPASHETRYRLLETVRAYAQEQLAEPGAPAAQARHLRFYAMRMVRAADEWHVMPIERWMAVYGRDLDNVRAALQCSLATPDADPADTEVGVQLAAASMPLWLEASLHAEGRRWAERALATGMAQPDQEQALQIALGTVLLHTEASHQQANLAFRRGLELAETGGEMEEALRALYGLWVQALRDWDYEHARTLASRFRDLAGRRGQADDIAVGDRLVGTSEHYLARQDSARQRLDAWFAALDAIGANARESRFGLDQRVAGLTSYARVLALQGEPDRATALAERAVREAESLSREASLCHALGEQCVIALWTKDLDTLGRAATALSAKIGRHGMPFWRPHVLVARAVLAGLADDRRASGMLLATAVRDVTMRRFDLVYPSLAAHVADGFRASGRIEEARGLLTQALARPNLVQRWNTPDLLLSRGALLLERRDPETEAAAERDFRAALEHARAQSAVLFERWATAALESVKAGRSVAGDTGAPPGDAARAHRPRRAKAKDAMAGEA